MAQGPPQRRPGDRRGGGSAGPAGAHARARGRRRPRISLALGAPLLAAVAAATGCFTAGYLAQAAGGELALLRAARSLDAVARDGAVPERVRALLALVPSIKAFGQARGLRPTRSYERYSDLHRGAAVYVVQACAPLAFDVRRWSFPLVGTVPYLGFFEEAAARRLANALARDEGLDVEVRTASAYSTLGFFRDPVLSTMITPGEKAAGDLANIILHESVHATVYVPGQTSLDESLASFAADRLTLDWLRQAYGPDAKATRAWEDAQALYQSRVARLHRAFLELDALYRSARGEAEKRARKAEILEALRAELGSARPLNNATLAGYKSYDTGSSDLTRLLDRCGGSWPRFFSALSALGSADFDRPQQEEFGGAIDRLASRGCGPAPAVERRAASPWSEGGGPGAVPP